MKRPSCECHNCWNQWEEWKATHPDKVVLEPCRHCKHIIPVAVGRVTTCLHCKKQWKPKRTRS